MEEDKSPVASTPAIATFQALNPVDTTIEVRQVPSPLQASDLRDDEQSTILGGSMEDISLITQPGEGLNQTVMDPEDNGGEQKTPARTPQSMVARKTRSHDNPHTGSESKRKLIDSPDLQEESQEDYTGKTEETFEIVDISEEESDYRQKIYSIVDKLNRTQIVEERKIDSPQQKVYNKALKQLKSKIGQIEVLGK